MMFVLKRSLIAFISILLTLIILNMICSFLLEYNIDGLILNIPHTKPEPHNKLKFEIAHSLSSLKTYEYKQITSQSIVPEFLKLEENFLDPAKKNLLPLKNYSGQASLIDTKTNFTIFSHNVITDEYRRRISRPLGSNNRANKHILMLGCSYVFGTGVENNETISWQMNEQQSSYEVYNNGYGGFGISDVLWIVENGQATEGLRQKRGIAIYTFIADHVHRSLNSTTNKPWGKTRSAYVETNENTFKYIGTFEESSYFKSHFYELLADSALFRFFKLNLPIITKNDLHRLARMIARARDLYAQQTDSENLFVVAIYPEPMNAIDLVEFKKALNKNKVYFIDYSVTNIELYSPENIRIPLDGHPNGKAHRLFGQVLLKDLKEFSSNK